MAQLCIDYASTDDQTSTPDFAKVRAAGGRMVIIRAIYGRAISGKGAIHNQGGTYWDPYWDRDYQAVLDAKLCLSAYLFLCVPRKGYTTPEPEVQAQALIDYVGSVLTPGNKLTCVPFFDVEEESDVLTSSQYFDWCLRAATVLRRHYGAWPGMYTSNRVWQEYLKGHASGLLQHCPLWIAKPWPWATRTPVHLDGAAGYSPTTIPEFGDATNWLLYQYQGDATHMPGMQSICDASRANMLYRGCHGTFVKWIQARVGAKVDGDFGTETEKDVKVVQAAHGLDADGIAGISTNCVLSWLRPDPAC